MRGRSRGNRSRAGRTGAVAKEDRENGALWGNGSPKDKESGGLEKNEGPDAGCRGRRGGPGATFSRGRAKKSPGSPKRAGAKRRSRLHRRVHTGISGQRYFGKLNDDKPKETNSSRGKVVCGVVAIKIFAARGDGKRKEDRARGCACRSKGRLGRRAGQFGCRLVGQFGCRSVGQVVCRFAVAEGNRRRLPGRCTGTTRKRRFGERKSLGKGCDGCSAGDEMTWNGGLTRT